MALWRMCVWMALASCVSATPATTAPPRPAAAPAPAAAPRPAEATTAAPPPDGQVRITPPVRISGDPNIVPPDSVKQEMLSARQSLLTGSFKLCVDPDGKVTEVTAIRPSGHVDFDRRVSERARTWQYRPGLLDGQPTGACVAVTLVYYQPAFSAAGMRLSRLHKRLFDAFAAAPDCQQREQLLHQFDREHAADVDAVRHEIDAYDASWTPAGGATRPHTSFDEELLWRFGPYVMPCDNKESLLTGLFLAGFRPASR